MLYFLLRTLLFVKNFLEPWYPATNYVEKKWQLLIYFRIERSGVKSKYRDLSFFKLNAKIPKRRIVHAQ